MNSSTRLSHIEAMLAESPDDPELRYFLAMEHLSVGNAAEGTRLLCAIATDSTFVPAFLQAGQALHREGRDVEACAILRRGIAAASAQGNQHALGEMQGLLDSIE